MILSTLNTIIGIALETMDTARWNGVLLTWRECKSKIILNMKMLILMKRLKRYKEFVRTPIEARGFTLRVFHECEFKLNYYHGNL